jgi:hypothetical protein
MMHNDEKDRELKAWHLLLEDDSYRLDFPDDFHQTLVVRADELVLREVITLEEWQKLKDVLDTVHRQTLQGLMAQQRDRLDTVSIDLRLGSVAQKSAPG